MIDERVVESRRRVWVGRVERLVETGYTVSEIAAILNLPESTVREYKNDIDAKTKTW